MSDEGEVGEEEGLVIPALEVRVPAEWQSKMSTRTLSSVTPTETPELAAACANIIEGKVKADAAGEELTTITEFGWKWLEAQHGSHKLAEAALASLVSGVESSWQQSPVVRLFGELCGMLSDEYSESVTKRVLGLLRDAEADDEGEESSGVALIELPAISTTLLGEGDVGTVALAQAVAALPRLQLPEERQQALEAELQAASASGPPTVRLDATLLAAVGACRAELGQQTEVGEEMSEEQQAAAAQAAAEAAAPAPPAEVVESEEEAEGGAASSSGVNWEVLAAKLPTTRPELAACQALFALFDPAANGSLTRQEAEAGILETLGVESGDEHGSAVGGAVGRGFDAAKQQAAEAGAEGGGDGEKLVVDEFRPLLLYVRRHLELLAAHPAGAQPEATLSAAELPRLAPRLARWGLADPAALLASLDDGSGAASFEAFSDAALRQLLASEEPLEGDGAAEVVDGLAGEGGGGAPPDDPLGGGRRLGAHDPPLEPVPETTEKSSFGTTTFGDAGGGGGGALGGFGSVQQGFFDASQLDLDEGGSPEPLAAESRPQPTDFDSAMAEVELLRSELRAATGQQDALKKLHARRMAGLLQQNDALQAQLRELNAQVERVLQREIRRHRPGGSGASPAAPSKSPPGKAAAMKPRPPKIAPQTKSGPPAAFFEAAPEK